MNTINTIKHKTITLDGVECYIIPVDIESCNKEEIKKLIGRLDDYVKGELLEKEVDKYANLRKLIGRRSDDLCIFGEKILKSLKYPNKEISIDYNNFNRELYDNPVNFEETTIDKLEYGDVFVLNTNRDTKDYGDVFIFMGTNYEDFYNFQCIESRHGIEIMDYGFYDNPDIKVIKALRH